MGDQRKEWFHVKREQYLWKRRFEPDLAGAKGILAQGTAGAKARGHLLLGDGANH